MATYHARVVRSGTHWAIHVREVDRWTQARNLREVESMARDLVAVMEDVEPDSFKLEVQVIPPTEIAKRVARMREFREEEAHARRRAAEELRAAARELRASGMPLRDVGQILDVSYQRAHQLVS